MKLTIVKKFCFKIHLNYLLFTLVSFVAVIINTQEIYAGSSQDTIIRNLSVATFDVDATPPCGSIMAYDTMVNSWDLGLRARGIVLLGAGLPIVACAFDWIGISNEGQDVFRQALADAAGTVPQRVVVHTVHQHDAPKCDFTAERMLCEAGLEPMDYDGNFAREVIIRLKTAVKNSIADAQPITHIGLGEAPVYEVASNRRILGSDGLVRDTRFTTCLDSALRAEPEGVIDPMVSLVSFWNNNHPVAVLSYYATHPQSYYRTGIANPDFPGIARFMRQLAVPDALHIHFNGAGGNLGAGKYNDGSHVNRGILADRLADGMKRAWDNTKRELITVDSVRWNFESIALPPAKYLIDLQDSLKNGDSLFLRKNAEPMAWLKRCQEGKKINISCLTLGRARILFMPGELFVEFQLAAKAERPDLFITMAAYGDYSPGYVCTAIAYEQGGYEAGIASYVTPEAEAIIMNAVKKLLHEKTY
jgi:hypothetical protein